ncbi:MAG: hypothetical protein KGZ90_10460 [Algoriphagus sp.]|nr:hypothetical protein [Algoriphagus sp.]
MKSRFYSFFLLSLIFFGTSSCDPDKPTPTPQKTPEQIATEALAGSGTQTWAVAGGGSVSRDGRTVTDLYSAFELVLNTTNTSKTYTTKNNNDLFDANGNWSFAGTNFDKIQLTGAKPVAGREISFTQTGSTLRLDFSVPVPGARTNGQQAVAGTYSFVLQKK